MRRVLFATLVWLWCANPTWATTYYVALTGGSNSNSCTTAQTVGTPKATITGATGGLACLASGDTLLVRTGTYDERILNGITAGTAGAYTRVANYNGEVVTLTPSSGTDAVIHLNAANTQYIEFDGINVNGTTIAGQGQFFDIGFRTQTNDVHHIRFKNATVTGGAHGGTIISLGSPSLQGTGGHEIQNVTVTGGGTGGTCGINCSAYGIYVSSSNNIIEDCNINDTSSRGISLHNSGAGLESSNNIVRNNRIHDITRTGTNNQYYGILMGTSSHQNLIYNNLIYDIGVGGNGSGIQIGPFSGQIGNKVWNNTIYSNNQYGLRIDTSASNTTVYNNIMDENGTDYSNAAASTTASNNLSATTVVFLDAASDDFHLTASSTNAIDTGTNIAAVTTIVTEDFAGTARPQGNTWDIGAYEFFVTPPPTPPTVNITAPTFESTYATQTTPLTSLAGTCTDTDGTIASNGVTWVNDRGGSGSATVSGEGTASVTWSVASITLLSGANVLTVTCTDDDAGTHQDTLNVTFTAPEPPVGSGGKRLRLQ